LKILHFQIVELLFW